ncbi:FGGY family carbohydrate kinase [soil metagenome]
MTFDSALLLGVDVGSSRTKALLVDPDGTELGSSVVPTPFESSAGGTEAPVDSMVAALGTALDGLGDDRRRVAAVGIAGIAESGAPLDRHGSPLGPVVAWHDRRGETVAERLSERFGRDLDLRIGQQIRYVSSVAKLGWLVDNGLTGVARWLGVPELGLHALTGAHATEYSLAARTGCFDVSRRSWLPDVAEAAGFGVDGFADVGPAGEVMGRVSADAAAWSGLPAGTPVTLAGHDHLAGVVGSGAGVDDLANSVGTAETVVGRTSTVPEMDQVLDRSLAVTVFPGGDGWAVLAGAARAGLAISAAAVTLGLELDELDRLAGGAPLLDAPDLLESLLRRYPPALPDGPP